MTRPDRIGSVGLTARRAKAPFLGRASERPRLQMATKPLLQRVSRAAVVQSAPPVFRVPAIQRAAAPPVYRLQAMGPGTAKRVTLRSKLPKAPAPASENLFCAPLTFLGQNRRGTFRRRRRGF